MQEPQVSDVWRAALQTTCPASFPDQGETIIHTTLPMLALVYIFCSTDNPMQDRSSFSGPSPRMSAFLGLLYDTDNCHLVLTG